MAYHAPFKECEGPDALCTVDDLVWYYEIARADLLLQTADGAEGDDCADADGAECGDVGASIDFMGGFFMMETVAGEKGDGDWFAGRGGGMVED